jgi:hypothetical protein
MLNSYQNAYRGNFLLSVVSAELENLQRNRIGVHFLFVDKEYKSYVQGDS